MVENRVGMGFAELKDRESKDVLIGESSKSKSLELSGRNHRARYRQARLEAFLRSKKGNSNSWNPFML